MGFLTAEQLSLQKLAQEFAEKEIRPVAAKYDEEEKFPDPVLIKMWEAGLTNMFIPAELGGSGLDNLSACLVFEELGRECAAIATASLVTSLALLPILLAGTPEQKQKIIPSFCKFPRQAAFCLTEPGAGSDAASISTCVERVEGGYLLKGTKCFITNGDVADLYTVFATADPSKGSKGLTAFIVPKGDGITVAKKERKMGLRAASTCTIHFDSVFVPIENMISEVGKGFKIAMLTLDASRPMIASIAVGVARAAFEESRKYAKERVQFGRRIADFQMIQTMLAEMATKIDAARLLVWRAATLIDKKVESVSKESSMSKLYAGDIAMEVTTDAVQILGGYGYSRDFPVEKYMRDAKIMQIYEGTNQIQRIVIANSILKGK